MRRDLKVMEQGFIVPSCGLLAAAKPDNGGGPER